LLHCSPILWREPRRCENMIAIIIYISADARTTLYSICYTTAASVCNVRICNYTRIYAYTCTAHGCRRRRLNSRLRAATMNQNQRLSFGSALRVMCAQPPHRHEKISFVHTHTHTHTHTSRVHVCEYRRVAVLTHVRGTINNARPGCASRLSIFNELCVLAPWAYTPVHVIIYMYIQYVYTQ